MRDTPVVSVIVSVSACADPLADSVAAVLRQRFEDFELLIVNAGEAWGGTERVSAQDERIRVLTPPRRGWAAALNTALRHGRAPFVALVGKGGRWGTDMLGRHVDQLRRDPALGVSLTSTPRAYGGGDGRAVVCRTLSPAALLVEAPRWHGATAVVRRAALDATAFRDWRGVYPELSYFDETLPACSTLDCLWRIGLGTHWKVGTLPGTPGSERTRVCAHGPEQLVAGWRLAIARARATAPDLVSSVEREATAHWLRYVAQHAANARDGVNAQALFRESFRLAPSLALRRPAETLRVMTATAAALGFGVGARPEPVSSVVV